MKRSPVHFIDSASMTDNDRDLMSRIIRKATINQRGDDRSLPPLRDRLRNHKYVAVTGCTQKQACGLLGLLTTGWVTENMHSQIITLSDIRQLTEKLLDGLQAAERRDRLNGVSK